MRRFILLVAALAMVSAACGNETGAAAGGGEVRTVLVDHKHDQFASAFLRYYPERVKVRPGDTVRFKQSWTGEAHSVTMGKVVDEYIKVIVPAIEKYPNEEDAPPELVQQVEELGTRLPPMVGNGFEVFQAGAQPCFVDDIGALPEFDPEKGDPGCPTKDERQPAFNGRQALYNSGFIPYEGEGGNTFEVPVAADTAPGTYQYYCNYHWVSMGGAIEVVGKGGEIPSQEAVSKQARVEIEEDAKVALQRVKEAQAGKTGELKPPLAGREADEKYAVIINEFFPAKQTVKVGQKVTWTFDGSAHTVSFNVPKYFPIFTVSEKTRKVTWNPKSYEPVGWDLPKPNFDEGPFSEEPSHVDAGEWDGGGGFHSSGAIGPPSTFSVTFTKPGTYPYACVLHPQMVGTVTVKA